MDTINVNNVSCVNSTPHDVVEGCLLHDLPDAIFLIDPESSHILYANKAAFESVGLTEKEILNQSVLSLQADVVNLPQWSEISKVISESEEPYVFLGRHKRRDGSVFPVEVRTSNLYKQGKHLFLSVARDITRRMILDEELDGHKHGLWYALNEATDGLWEWNIQSNELYVSPKLKQMRGFGPHEKVASVDFWTGAIHPEDKDRVLAIMDEHIKGKLERFEAIYRLKNRAGHYIWVHDTGKISEFDSQGNPTVAVGMVQNVTDQVKLRERLENQAARDELTAVFNRRVCKEVIEQQIVTSRIGGTSFAVFLVDIDHFKAVNDCYGHCSGDKVLRAFTDVVQTHLREEDVLFRWGGEEFVVLLPGLDKNSVTPAAENLRHCIENHPVVLSETETVGLTASIGVSIYPMHGADRQQLIQKADIAMYRAKNNGRNRTEIFNDN
ncbi:diguanylate cyclase [Vibrio hannami]|uniref:sensor domain-containing diguanylate cyclase n=1 Tax=Vibrio hannami TaxID=2717094 RepID=UPI00240FA637|nr:diguanylate cyclase [Vibrio hannami]MDG3085771.1 diguanylate cyclase [Vibrio hannami]